MKRENKMFASVAEVFKNDGPRRGQGSGKDRLKEGMM
jgi:hypothetical protein